MILDGFGIAPKSEGNAVTLAKKPNLDKLFEKHDIKKQKVDLKMESIYLKESGRTLPKSTRYFKN